MTERTSPDLKTFTPVDISSIFNLTRIPEEDIQARMNGILGGIERQARQLRDERTTAYPERDEQMLALGSLKMILTTSQPTFELLGVKRAGQLRATWKTCGFIPFIPGRQRTLLDLDPTIRIDAAVSLGTGPLSQSDYERIRKDLSTAPDGPSAGTIAQSLSMQLRSVQPELLALRAHVSMANTDSNTFPISVLSLNRFAPRAAIPALPDAHTLWALSAAMASIGRGDHHPGV